MSPATDAATLGIAIAQMVSEPGRVSDNLERMLGHVAAAQASGADLVVFPEMADTGYDMHEIVRHASDWEQPGPLQQLAAAAQTHRIHIIAGLSEKTAAGIYNTLAVLDPAGRLITRYRKVHLITAAPVHEHHHLLAGQSFQTCQIAGFTVGLMTCYDLRFPEQARALMLAGAEVLVLCSAFPLVRLPHWETLVAARAIENQVYLAACNRVGTDSGLAFAGHSQLLDPYGCVLTSASTVDTQLLRGEIRRERIQEVRHRLQCLRDRRPDLYRHS
jgi:omega-amidase